jgi:peptidoglycan L-alanyl-D-glutamate endopeptidase CwlK
MPAYSSTSLDDLDSRFRPVAEELLRRCNKLEPIRVICTLRSNEAQIQAFDKGFSRTRRGYHQPQSPEGKAWAIDIAPKRLLLIPDWSPTDPVWAQIGAIGVELGLTWGGNWKRFPDRPHFEWHPPEAA